MKKLFLMLLAVAALNGSTILPSSGMATENSNDTHVVAYYFHGAMRCPACHKLEQYSKEAIETIFKEALQSGKLEYKVINVEDRGNEHYATGYQLYTKAIILSLVKDGKEIKWKNLDKIWEYVGDKKRFVNYIKSEVSDFMKESE